MASLSRGLSLSRTPQLARALRCPQCRLPQRRLLTFSTALSQAQAPAKGSSLRDRLRSGSADKASKPSKGAAHPKGGGAVRRIFGQTPDKPIRTRFAPSPTGYLHLGSLRTALFNNLASVASTGGAFILRIEDTDQTRLVPGAEDRIIRDLKWLGLEWSEGPDCGGPHGPYRQSERLPIYKAHVDRLVASGHAYRCFCRPADLEKQKLALHNAGRPTFYPGTCRSVHADESEARAAAGEPHVVRFRGDAFGALGHRDAIYGAFQKKEAEDDFVIFKTDGFPTYHLANVVDDHLMGITHVVRGEEWLISTPKHLALYKAFGWTPPTFAHLGLLVNTDGTKLSKRNASANVSRYQEQAYSPMAMQAWLANLGSSFQPGRHDVSPRSLADVADALSFKFTRGGIKLNPEKLDGFDVKYHRSLVLAPPSDPAQADRERQLLERDILTPMLNLITKLTTTSTSTPAASDNDAAISDVSDTNVPDTLPPAWDNPSPVPRLSPATATSYLHTLVSRLITTGRYKKRGDALRLVTGHPHYFFRVPPSLYAASLAALDGPQRTKLSSLLQVLATLSTEEMAPLWTDDGSKLLPALRDALAGSIPDMDLYALQRLVATGQSDASTHSATDLFVLLGREEWAYRAAVVSVLLARAQHA